MKGIRSSELFTLSSIIFITIFSSVLAFSTSLAMKSLVIAPAEVNGRILITNINSSKVSVLLQINTTSGSEGLGGATMIVGFDTSSIAFIANPVKNIDYVFHNFCGGYYSLATITRPMENRIWLNIDLPFQNYNEGTLVAGGSNWTDIATIYFDVVDQNGLINIYWLCSSPFWGIYDDDNITFWKIGHFKDALDIPLPVELSSFTAKLVGAKVKLDWTTESEVNNYGFDVERKVNDSKWNKLGFVEGNGNSNTPKSYSFIDNALSGGSIFYYRLKQIDTDGNFEYSEIILVEAITQNFSLSQNYPNPFNPSTVISYQLPVNGNVTLKVYDVLGNEVAVLVDEEIPSGVYEINFNAANLASGIYFYKIQAASFIETKKMILLK